MTEPSLQVQERRSSPRIPAKFRVRPDGAEQYEDASGDLSLGGVLWNAQRKLSATRVEVSLNIPGRDEELVAEGEVLYRRMVDGGPAYAIRFKELPADGELQLARYLHEVAVGWE